MPKSLTNLESGAFSACISLDSIFIPTNVKPSWRTPFVSCWNLRRIVVDEHNPYLSSYGDCNALVDVKHKRLVGGCQTTKIPDGVEEIESFAFSGVYTLHSVYIPSSVKRLDGSVFAWCHGLTSISVDPDNPWYDSREDCNAVIETATNALVAGCLTTRLPSSVEGIDPMAFSNIRMPNVLILPEGLKEIKTSAFYGCEGMKYVYVPRSLRVIRDLAFNRCFDVEHVFIPSADTVLEEDALSKTESPKPLMPELEP